MSKPVVIIGGGGHALVVADALLSCRQPVLGIIDPHLSPGSAWHMNLTVLGDDELLGHYDPERIVLANGVGQMPGRWQESNRYRIFESWRLRDYVFTSVVHPRACIAREVTIGLGVQLLAGCVINPGAHIGDNTIINTNATVEHGVTIGDHVHIAPGAVICGDAVIGDGAFVGANATVIQQQVLAAGGLVAAGCCLK